jgi:type II secretory pathway component PulL
MPIPADLEAALQQIERDFASHQKSLRASIEARIHDFDAMENARYGLEQALESVTDEAVRAEASERIESMLRRHLGQG